MTYTNWSFPQLIPYEIHLFLQELQGWLHVYIAAAHAMQRMFCAE